MFGLITRFRKHFVKESCEALNARIMQPGKTPKVKMNRFGLEDVPCPVVIVLFPLST